MNAPRIIPAGPMPHDAILPLIREVGSLRERGEYGAAAELEERIRQPLTVAGRVLEPCGDRDMRWYHHDIMLEVRCDAWVCVLTMHGTPDTAIQVQTQGRGPTIAAALADAQARYQAAIADTLLRMGGLLREVVLCGRCDSCNRRGMTATPTTTARQRMTRQSRQRSAWRTSTGERQSASKCATSAACATATAR